MTLSRLTTRLMICFMLLVPLPAQAGGLIRDAEIEKLLRDYSRPIFIAAGLKPQNIGIGIIDDRSLNAFVAGGQNIFFHTGLILEAETPNMVIGVIAHETGHITGGHLARMPEAFRNARTPLVLSALLGIGAIAAGQADAGLAIITGGQQIAQGNLLSFSRAQEAAADQVALRLLNETKQSPIGILNFMDKLADQEILSEVSQDPYIRSHPLSRDRVSAYKAAMQKSDYQYVKDSDALMKRHKLVQAKIYGFLDHPSTTLRRYTRNNDLPARYAKTIAYHKKGMIEDALKHGLTLIQEKPENPYFHELLGQILYESGSARSAIPHYETSLTYAPEEPLILIALATARLGLETKQDAAKAIKLLKKSLRLDAENPSAFYQLAIAQSQLGNIAEAELATAERFYLYGNKEKARTHAERALKIFSKGTPSWFRAKDIASQV